MPDVVDSATSGGREGKGRFGCVGPGRQPATASGSAKAELPHAASGEKVARAAPARKAAATGIARAWPAVAVPYGPLLLGLLWVCLFREIFWVWLR